MITINLKNIVDYTMCMILALCILLIPILSLAIDDIIAGKYPIMKVVSKILLFVDIYVVIQLLHTVICGGMI